MQVLYKVDFVFSCVLEFFFEFVQHIQRLVFFLPQSLALLSVQPESILLLVVVFSEKPRLLVVLVPILFKPVGNVVVGIFVYEFIFIFQPQPVQLSLDFIHLSRIDLETCQNFSFYVDQGVQLDLFGP